MTMISEKRQIAAVKARQGSEVLAWMCHQCTCVNKRLVWARAIVVEEAEYHFNQDHSVTEDQHSIKYCINRPLDILNSGSASESD